MNARGTFTVSSSCIDPQKVASCDHNSLRTSASASEKVGQLLSYQAALRTMSSPFLAMCRWARSMITENSPSNAGAVLRIANSDQCRCVSKPRRWRTSWNVLSICQRLTNHEMICSGSVARSVQRSAWGWNSSCGSRINTQRNGTAGKPVEYQTAVLETISIVRFCLPYQFATMIGFQPVEESSATTERLGKRSPLSRGRPIWPGYRGGAGL